MPAPDHAVLYDADCGFCIRSLDRIMRRDRDGRLRAVAIQSEEGQALLASIPETERLDSWHLVEPGGKVLSAGAAAPALFRLLRGGRVPAALAAALPAATELGYRLVARNRGLFSRFLVLAVSLLLLGCGSTIQDGTGLTVYLSAPAETRGGAALISGAEEALEEAGGEAGGAPVRLEVLDREDFSNAQAEAASNARIATSDSTGIAYIGESGAGGELASVPVTNAAGMLQVAPLAVDPALLREGPGDNDVPSGSQPSGERTFGALEVGSALPPRATRGPAAGTLVLAGFEAMALVLASIDRAADPLDRASVVEAFLATAQRESVYGGTYTIDPAGIAVDSEE